MLIVRIRETFEETNFDYAMAAYWDVNWHEYQAYYNKNYWGILPEDDLRILKVLSLIDKHYPDEFLWW